MKNNIFKKDAVILSVDTSCDETSAAVTKGLKVLSNIIWSQANIHAKFGGVVPSEAKRQHERKIFWVVERAVNTANIKYRNFDAFSVTVGPGLAIALGVGINFAKQLYEKYHKPLISVNHLEGHILSSLAKKKNSLEKTSEENINKYFPAYGIVVSGGNTILLLIENIGKYKTLALTIDDALGESLDKSARFLGLGYPGGSILEKFARHGNPKKYHFTIPLLGRENEGHYSYSGIKTAFIRQVKDLMLKNKILSKDQVCDLAASYQHTAFEHFFRVTDKTLISTITPDIKHLFIGGGVAANVDFRKRTRGLCKKYNLTPLFPYSKKLYGDNAAMIGVAAYFKYLKEDFSDPTTLDRLPNMKIDNN